MIYLLLIGFSIVAFRSRIVNISLTAIWTNYNFSFCFIRQFTGNLSHFLHLFCFLFALFIKISLIILLYSLRVLNSVSVSFFLFILLQTIHFHFPFYCYFVYFLYCCVQNAIYRIVPTKKCSDRSVGAFFCRNNPINGILDTAIEKIDEITIKWEMEMYRLQQYKKEKTDRNTVKNP